MALESDRRDFIIIVNCNASLQFRQQIDAV